MGNSFIVLSNCIQFLLHLIISLGLLLMLPKDSAGVGDVNENPEKAKIKIQIKSFSRSNAGWRKVA